MRVVRLLRSEVQSVAGLDQLSTGIKDGCVKVYHTVRTMCRQSAERGIVARDVSSVHLYIVRRHAAKEIAARCPQLLQPFLTWYARTTTHVWRSALNELLPANASRGVNQGDPLAIPVFALTMS